MEVESAAIPALNLLFSVELRFFALAVMSPPSTLVTSIAAPLFKMISALATSSGKTKLPFSAILTVPAADKPPCSILPPGAVA